MTSSNIPSILNNITTSNKDIGESMSKWASSFVESESKNDASVVTNANKQKCSRPNCNNVETDSPFKKCAKCGIPYCDRECQVQHWKDGHKSECNTIATLQSNRNEVVKTILSELLFYISPCVVSNYLRKGRGILFAFTEQPLQQYIDHQLKRPGNYDRQVILQYFNEQELINVFLKRVGISSTSTESLMSKLPPKVLDVLVQTVIPSLLGYVKTYDPKTNFHFLFASGCGYVTSMQSSLFPDFEKSKKQASSFDEMEVVLLNLDRS